MSQDLIGVYQVDLDVKTHRDRSSMASCARSEDEQRASPTTITREPASTADSTVERTHTSVSDPVTISVYLLQ